MSHLNSSSGSVEPALYYAGQKRPGEDGGKSPELDLFYHRVFQCLIVREEEGRSHIGFSSEEGRPNLEPLT